MSHQNKILFFFDITNNLNWNIINKKGLFADCVQY